MEENKEKNDICANCPYNKCKTGHCYGYKCHGLICKILIPIILLALAFYLGAMVGRGDDFRGRMEGQRFVDKVDGMRENIKNKASDSTTINVIPEDTIVDTNIIPVLE